MGVVARGQWLVSYCAQPCTLLSEHLSTWRVGFVFCMCVTMMEHECTLEIFTGFTLHALSWFNATICVFVAGSKTDVFLHQVSNAYKVLHATSPLKATLTAVTGLCVWYTTSMASWYFLKTDYFIDKLRFKRENQFIVKIDYVCDIRIHKCWDQE